MEVILVTVQSILRQVPDPRGGQGRQHPLFALLGLVLLSLMSGRTGVNAAFQLGRRLTRHQLRALGFRPGYASPCHTTITQLLSILDPDAMVSVFSQVTEKPNDETASDYSQIMIDGKTLRESKDNVAKVEHVLSVFCAQLERSVSYTLSRGKGMKVADALKLIVKLDLTDKTTTGDAIYRQ